MTSNRRTLRDVLRSTKGIASSIPEALAGTVMKIIVFTVVGGVIAGGFAFWAQATASAQTSSAFQNANVAFEKAVRDSDIVTGRSTNRLGLLRDLPGGRCEVQTWQPRTVNGKVSLQVDTRSVAGACTPTTALPTAGSAADTKELVVDVTGPAFAYANRGGRTITFDTNGAATLASGVKPDGVKTADWEDPRPYKVTMTLTSRNDANAAAVKKSVSTGFATLASVADQPTPPGGGPNYVGNLPNVPAPGPVKITGVARSTQAGDLFGGVREGAAVTFTGGYCPGVPTKVTVSFAQQVPSAAPAVSAILNGTRNGSASTVHLAQVPNGSTGTVEVTATCADGGPAASDARGYTQTVPALPMSVTQGSKLNAHNVKWEKISSLPTTYTVTKKSAYGTELDTPVVTTGLAKNYVYTEGMTFGNKTDYTVTATVAGTDVAASASITTAWPTVPAATGITWKHTGANRADPKISLNWSFTTGCPAGTTLNARVLENRTGQSNGTYSTATRATGAWTANLKSYTWKPSYALQGYSYGIRVESFCDSNVTPFTSTTQGVQSPYFTTPMAQPAAPVWDAYNHKENKRGTDRTWSTCYWGNEMPVCPTMTIDYKTFCPSGSWVGWSNFSSTAPQNPIYNHPFGWKDYWYVKDVANIKVTYYNPAYQCFTPWVDNVGADTPENPRTITSPYGASKVVTVWRIWPY